MQCSISVNVSMAASENPESIQTFWVSKCALFMEIIISSRNLQDTNPRHKFSWNTFNYHSQKSSNWPFNHTKYYVLATKSNNWNRFYLSESKQKVTEHLILLDSVR